MANTVIYNGKEYKSNTAVKAQARLEVMEVVANALTEAFGEGLVQKVGTNEYGVVVGEVLDKDGFGQDVCITLKPVVKEWEDRKTDKRKFEKFDLNTAAEMYQLEVDEKEEKAKEKARLKKEKIARDKKAREEKKEAEATKEENNNG